MVQRKYLDKMREYEYRSVACSIVKGFVIGCCTKCYNTDRIEEMGWAVHAACTTERIDKCKSGKIKICTHGNLLENCSKSLFCEL
jgi:hypothetical protein